jgi:hypothetical protein
MSEIEITLLTKAGGPLTKRITLPNDGKLHSDGSACRMARGNARRMRLARPAELTGVVEDHSLVDRMFGVLAPMLKQKNNGIDDTLRDAHARVVDLIVDEEWL